MGNAECLVCRKKIAERYDGHDGEGYLVFSIQCPECGTYRGRLDEVASELRAETHTPLMPFLAAHIRQANERGEDPVDVTSRNWHGYAEAHARTPVIVKLNLLMRWFERNSPHAGTYVREPGAEVAPLVDATNAAELKFLETTLVEQGLLKVPDGVSFWITAKGWEYLAPSTPSGVPGTCFVAMSFDQSLNAAFDDGLRPAIEDDCGFKVIRVDRVHHNENINDKIIADLRGAQFVVADFSLHKAGVYFEAGFALGLGRIVIWTCRKSDFDEAHFDTRPYNHIIWSSPGELREKVAARIRATVPGAPSSK